MGGMFGQSAGSSGFSDIKTFTKTYYHPFQKKKKIGTLCKKNMKIYLLYPRKNIIAEAGKQLSSTKQNHKHHIT